MTPWSMDRQEVYDRYLRARALAESELQNFVFKINPGDDVYDAFEIAFFWRMLLMGYEVPEEMLEMMIEATN